MNGLAITIIVGQLPKLCGFSTDADGFVDEVKEFFKGFDERNSTALTLGLVTLAVLLVLPRFTKTIPAVLVAVVGATVVDGAGRSRHQHGGRAPRGASPSGAALDRLGRCRTDAHRGDRHHAGVARPTPSPHRRASRPAEATRSTRTRR